MNAPDADRPAEASTEASTEASAERGFSILVVDDNEMNRDMLSRRLKRKKFPVEVAEDGAQALWMIEQGSYGLILLDIMMPGIDGIEVLKRLREKHSPSELPVIMATAKDASEDVVEALKLGANDYVTKPLDFPVVLARVQTQLALKTAHDEVQKRNDFIKKVFGRYLTDDVVSKLLDTPEGLHFGGETRRVTVLMSDVRGFSALCERLDPEQVVQILNIYLGSMAEVIAAHKGTIDEFIGDAVLAIFGAPFELDHHEEQAVRCALSMQRAMESVNAMLRARGLPGLEMGIGLNTGDVVVGNIGSEQRAKFGVIGSPVNLTARVESYTVGGQVLVSETTAGALEDRLVSPRSFEVEAKGLARPVRIIDVVGVRGEGGAPDLMLEASDDEVIALEPPLEVELVVLEGKHVGAERHPGGFVALGARTARLDAGGVEVPVLGNLKMQVKSESGEMVGNLYAKVLEVAGDSGEGHLIRFTSVDPEVDVVLATRRPAGGES